MQVRDEAAKSKNWGLGRLLRTQRDVSKEVAAAGDDADRVLVTAASLGKARVRFTKCESPLVDAAVYTIAISSGTSESFLESGADWIIQRTFSKLQGVNAVFQNDLGERYTKSPFPDSLFTTAVTRMPLLQAWLQDAIELVPYCNETAQQKVALLLGARMAARDNTPQGSPKKAGASASLVDVEPLIGERLRIPVGPSRSNTKRVQLPLNGLVVNPQPVNPQDPQWSDTFVLEVVGSLLTVRRIDSNGGWTQDLELMALAPSDDDLRDSSASFTMQVVDPDPPPF